MNTEYILENYEFEKLTDKYELSSFKCEDEDLTDFLINDAIEQQKEKLNATQLIVCDNIIIGFVTLLADKLKLTKLPDKTKQNIKELLPKMKEAPAIKIGRFAISKEYSNKGIGTEIMKQIIGEITENISSKIGLRIIIVEGYAGAYNFYKRTNFEPLNKSKKESKKLIKAKQQNPSQTFVLYQDITKINL